MSEIVNETGSTIFLEEKYLDDYEDMAANIRTQQAIFKISIYLKSTSFLNFFD